MNFETWYLFDKQFKDNKQRVIALDIVEKVVAIFPELKDIELEAKEDPAQSPLDACSDEIKQNDDIKEQENKEFSPSKIGDEV